MGHESFDLLLLGKLVTFFPSVFSFLSLSLRSSSSPVVLFLLSKVFFRKLSSIVDGSSFSFWRTGKNSFYFFNSPFLYRFRIVLRKDSVRERAKRIRSNEVQELFMMLSSVETWPMCLIFWGFCTSGRMHDGRGKRKGNFPNVQHFRREIGQFVLKVKLM